MVNDQTVSAVLEGLELERRVRELSSLLEVSRVINSNFDYDRVLTTVLEQAIKVIGAERGTLWTLEDNGTAIVAQASIGPAAQDINQVRLSAGEGIAGKVIESGLGDLICDARLDARWSNRVDSLTGLTTRSVVVAPLKGKQQTIGCLQLINKCNGQLFQAADLELLTALGAQAALVIENSRLLEETRAFARRLEEAWRSTLDALAAALATRDNDTSAHCYRTVELAVLLARRMNVPESELPALARGAFLHDIGKIGIADRILYKPGQLSDEERAAMSRHVELGHDMLKPIPFFNDALPIVLYHHENYDGSGYLRGMRGEEIPLAARIFHVVDAYDALVSQRPYKEAWTHERALQEIERQSGAAFDPVVVKVLAELTPAEVECIRNTQHLSTETQSLIGRRGS